MKFLSIIILSFVVFATTATAQFNDSTHYQVRYAGTGILNRTNTSESYITNQAVKFNMLTNKVELNFNNTYTYGEQRRKLSNNDFSSSLDINYYSTIPHFFYWVLAIYETSFSLKINNRGQQGLGLAYRVLDRGDSLQVLLTNGILYEQSNINLSDGEQKIYSTFRNSFRIKSKIRRGKFTFEGIGFYQPSLQDGNDYIIKGNGTMAYRFWKYLSFTTNLTYNYQNLNKTENLYMSVGLGFDRFF